MTLTAENLEVRRLQTAVQELSILNEIATEVSSTRELEEVVELIIQKCVKHLNVEQGAIMLLEAENKGNPFQTMVRKTDTEAEVIPFHFGLQLSGWMLKNQKPLVINDFGTDGRFRVPDTEFPIHSLLSVPLRLKGNLIGVLNVFNKRSVERFSEADKRLLAIIAAQSAQIIENARLYGEEQALFRIEEELRLAHVIQANLLPKDNPQIPGYDISGVSVSAREVGGDYYDFIVLDEHRMAICLGDVSGKGMPAALLMANLQATLRGQSQYSETCAECLFGSNNLLFHSTDTDKFATLFYGILDRRTHTLTYSRAGHDPPFFYSARNGLSRLKAGGTVLGFMENTTYEEESISFEPGDTLTIFSDGITDAMDIHEHHFSEDRLKKIIMDSVDRSPSSVVEQTFEAVNRHTGDESQTDDMTLVILNRGKP